MKTVTKTAHGFVGGKLKETKTFLGYEVDPETGAMRRTIEYPTKEALMLAIEQSTVEWRINNPRRGNRTMNKHILAAVIACAMVGPAAAADDWSQQLQQSLEASRLRGEMDAIQNQQIFQQWQQERRANEQERQLKDMQDQIKEMNQWPGKIR